jgi:hypothetical protein
VCACACVCGVCACVCVCGVCVRVCVVCACVCVCVSGKTLFSVPPCFYSNPASFAVNYDKRPAVRLVTAGLGTLGSEVKSGWGKEIQVGSLMNEFERNNSNGEGGGLVGFGCVARSSSCDRTFGWTGPE